MVTAQIKEGQKLNCDVKSDISEKIFFSKSDLRNGISKYHSIALAIFAMLHPQITEIRPFNVECFRRKSSNFNMMTSLFMT